MELLVQFAGVEISMLLKCEWTILICPPQVKVCYTRVMIMVLVYLHVIQLAPSGYELGFL